MDYPLFVLIVFLKVRKGYSTFAWNMKENAILMVPLALVVRMALMVDVARFKFLIKTSF
jgi:hypothetical protein